MQPIFTLTLRALARNRRSLVVAALLCVPVLLALIYVASEGKSKGESFVLELFINLVLPILLPLTALIFATSALGIAGRVYLCAALGGHRVAAFHRSCYFLGAPLCRRHTGR